MIRGKQKLLNMVEHFSINTLFRVITNRNSYNSKYAVFSIDRDIEEYFFYIRNTNIDDLSKNDSILIEKALNLRSFGFIKKEDARYQKIKDVAIYNLCNYIVKDTPLYSSTSLFSPELWYKTGSLDFLRKNHKTVAKERIKNKLPPCSYRIEIFSQNELIKSNPIDKYFLLLHFWEEVCVNNTKLEIINIDGINTKLLDNIKDAHIILDKKQKGVFFKGDCKQFEDPSGNHKANDVKNYFEELNSIRKQYSRKVSADDFNELCSEWKDGYLHKFIKIWNATTHYNDPIKQILTSMHTNNIMKASNTHKIPRSLKNSGTYVNNEITNEMYCELLKLSSLHRN